eukprot:SAG11_NODE_1857_length_4161_cov_2.269079_2_plen_99_part_00
MAQAHSKPFYVAAESYKFARLYPLSQRDVPNTSNSAESTPPPMAAAAGRLHGLGLPGKLQLLNPARDFTPPQYITLLVTDLGVLTPAAVSDELIKLYC